MRVILEYDTKSNSWFAFIEGVTGKHGPYASGLEAATEFFKAISTYP